MKTISQSKIHDGQQFSFYPNALGRISFPSSIHPGPRDRKTQIHKRQNHIQNHQERAEINRNRSNSKNNPTYHGQGRHAGVKRGF